MMLPSLILLFSGTAASIDSSTCSNVSQQDVGSLMQLGKIHEGNTWSSYVGDWEMCGLPCATGSCSNYLVKAATMEECNLISQSNNCGNCKSASAVQADANLFQYVQAFGSQLGGMAFVTACGAKPSHCPENVITDEKDKWHAVRQCMPCGFYVSCQAGCDTGSCDNYLIAANNMDDCNVVSQDMGCGSCKASVPPELNAISQRFGASFATLCEDTKQPDFTYPPGNKDSDYKDYNFRAKCALQGDTGLFDICGGYHTQVHGALQHSAATYQCCPGMQEKDDYSGTYSDWCA
eukprot:TRINITY_DN21134_c0_g1_i1.p1 TRINITY_DN21134_c0_g1~~TRINITY_DN21134_c0_g1_i1.p1  ORF type:complete len:292 (-),score=37.53 TRINITY_DN21134_c0_g1_i1:23-898(-)